MSLKNNTNAHFYVQGTLEAFGLESDSFTENISPFKEYFFK